MPQKIKSQVLSVAFKVLHGQGSGCNATSIIILLLPHSSLSHDLPVIPQTSQGLSDSGPFYLLIYLFPQIAACYFIFIFVLFLVGGGSSLQYGNFSKKLSVIIVSAILNPITSQTSFLFSLPL